MAIDNNSIVSKDPAVRLRESVLMRHGIITSGGYASQFAAKLAAAGLTSDFVGNIPLMQDPTDLDAINRLAEEFMHDYGLFSVEATPPVVEMYFEDVIADVDAALAKFHLDLAAAYSVNTASVIVYFKRRDDATSQYLDIGTNYGDKVLDLHQFKHVTFRAVEDDRLTIRKCDVRLNEELAVWSIDDVLLMPNEILPYQSDGSPAAAFDGRMGLLLRGGGISSSTAGQGMSARRMECLTIVTSQGITTSQLNYPLSAPLGMFMNANDITMPVNNEDDGIIELAAGRTNVIVIKGAQVYGSSASTALLTCPDGATVSISQLTILHDYYSPGLLTRYKLFDDKDLADYQIDNAYIARTPNLQAGAAITQQLLGWFPVDTAGDPVAHYANLTLDDVNVTGSFNNEVQADVTNRLVLHNVRLVRGTTNPFITLINNCIVQITDCHFSGAADWPVIAEDVTAAPTVNVIVNSSVLETGLTQWLKTGSTGTVGDNVENGTVVDNTVAHALGGVKHTASTLAQLNALVSDANMDDAGDPRDPNAHGLAGAEHSTATLAQLNAKVSDANLDDAGDPRDPNAHGLAGTEHSTATLAQLNAKVSDANLDDAGDPRDPNNHASSHQHGGGDEIATATPGANAIPKADGTGKLDAWVTGMTIHAIGGASHSASTLVQLNAKISDANLDDAGDPRDPNAHGLAGAEHSTATLAQLNAKISDANLDDAGDPRDPNAHGLGGAEHSTATLAQLNAKISDANLDDAGDPRDPNAHGLAGAEHSTATLAQLNAKISDANLDDAGDPRTPSSHALAGAEHSTSTLAQVNAKISDGTLIDTGDSRLSDARTPLSHSSSHQHGGSDEIATATPAANAIPKADGTGKLDAWVTGGSGATWTPSVTRHVHISEGGSSGADGSPWDPYDTLSEALSDIGDDCMYCLHGTITETTSINLNSYTNIAIIGDGQEYSKLTCSAASQTLRLASTGARSGYVIRDLTLENTNNSASSQAWELLMQSSGTVEHLYINDVSFAARGGNVCEFACSSASVVLGAHYISNISIEWLDIPSAPGATLYGLNFSDFDGTSNTLIIHGVHLVNLGYGTTDDANVYGVYAPTLQGKVIIHDLTADVTPIVTGTKMIANCAHSVHIEGASVRVNAGNDIVGNAYGIQNCVCHNCKVYIYREFDAQPGSASYTVGLIPSADSFGNIGHVYMKTTGTWTLNQITLGLWMIRAPGFDGPNTGILEIDHPGGATLTASNDFLIGGVGFTASQNLVSAEINAVFAAGRNGGSGTATFVDFDACRCDGGGVGSTRISTLNATLMNKEQVLMALTTCAALGLQKDLLANAVMLGQAVLMYSDASVGSYTGGAVRRRLKSGGSGNPELYLSADSVVRARFTADQDGNVTETYTNMATIV